MSERNWERIWLLFTEARDLDPAARERLLKDVPAEIAAEVRALIEDDAQPSGPAPGARYGRYTLIDTLGRGGMGQVFSARDTELGRTVAIKFLNLKAGVLPDAVRHLIAEAQTASALNHPSLITVHEILHYDAGVAVVSELVKGQPLRAFCGVARPLQQVAAWGAQMARALAAAHAESIVHGDVKPENVMIRGDGLIKILDFGIARHNASSDGIAALPLGTVGYMSPEQLRGEALTASSDVFSLGVVLLELATGKHPFLDETPASTALAIGQREVEIAIPSIKGGQAFARLLRSMLAKDAAARPTAAVVASRLERIAAQRRFGVTGWIAAAALAAGGALFWFRAAESPTPVKLSTPTAITNYNGVERQPAISPDGTRFLFTWNGGGADHDEVYMRSIAADDLRQITGDSRPKNTPVWSPDGRSIAWMSRARDGSDTLIFVAPVGGSPRLAGSVADHEGFYGIEFWPDSGSIVVSDREPSGRSLVRLNLANGSKTILTHPSGASDHHPLLSPDHRRLLFMRSQPGVTHVCQMELTAQTRETCFDTGNAGAAAWLADSHTVLYADAQTLWQMNLDRPSPRPIRVSEGTFYQLRNSPNGRSFAFSRIMIDLNIWRLDTATGKATQFQASSAEDSEPQFSPDGSQVLFRSNRSGAYELFLCAPDGSGTRAITSLRGEIGSAVWSPDGKWIAFDTSNDANAPLRFLNIAIIPAEGGAVRRITPDDAEYSVPGWSADGRFIYCRRGNNRQMVKVPVAGGPPVDVMRHEMFDVRERSTGQFLFARPEPGKGIWTMEPGGAESIVKGTEGAMYRAWDVRGSSLYFLREAPGGGFFKTGLDGSGPRKLRGEPPRRILHGPRNISASPDGQIILYTSEDLVVGDIFLMEALPRKTQ